MGYIGKLPATQGKDAGPALKLDDISSNFDGLTNVFSLAVGGTAVTPHVNNISIYLSGVYQIPGNSYSLSGSFIVFTGAPSSSLDFHGALLGTSRLFIPDNDTVETSAFTTDTITSISGSRDAASISGSFGNQRVGTTDNVQFNHITASGNISSSGIVIADTFQSTGGSVDGISFTDDLNITGNITASGEISSSGNLSSTGNLDIDGTSNLQGDVTIQSDLGVVDINASGNITGSVVSASVSKFTTATIDKIGGAINFNDENMTNVDIDSGNIDTVTFGSTVQSMISGSLDAASISGSRDAASISGSFGNQRVGTTDDVKFANITSSNDISASGDVSAINFYGQVATAAQTNITSLLATDIKIGEDNETRIDFGTPNEIHFFAGNQRQLDLEDGVFAPTSDSDVDLGNNSQRWKDAYIDSVIVTSHITASGAISASGNLSATGNLDIDGTSNFAGDVTLQNDLVVTGRIDAEEIHTTFISSSITQATGSNLFGDATTDSHQFTGSVDISGSLRVSDGNVVVSDTLTATNIGAFTAAGAIDFDNQNMTNVDIDSGVITGITDITVADGGTGVSTLTDGGVLLGSGTSAITAMAVLTDGQMIVGDGTTDPVAESGATLRTSIGVGTTDDVKFANITGSGNISGSFTSTGSFGSVVAGGTGVNSFTGLVGIGTIAPDSQLHVAAAGSPSIRVTDTTNTITGKFQSDNSVSKIGTHTNHPFTLLANNTEVMRVLGSGLVGINCVPTDELTIDSSSDPAIVIKRSSASAQINKILTDSSGLYFSSAGHATGANNQIGFLVTGSNSDTTAGINAMRIKSDGKVGIGTTSPDEMLHVASDTKVGGTIRVGDGSAGAPSYRFTNDTDTGIYWAGTNSIGFVTGGTSRLEIRANGSLASLHASGATSNTAFGEDAGIALASGGNYNTLFGHGAGQLITTADQNVLIGYQAGDAIVDGGHFNIAMGTNALGALTSGDENIAIGDSAGVNMTGTSRCVLVGSGAGLDINHDDAQGTVAVGYQAGANITSGQHNTFVGYEAGKLDITGDNNVAIGYAAFDETSNASSENVYIGVGAGGGNDGATASDFNVGIGRDALGGAGMSEADHNTAVGQESGVAITAGKRNTMLGAAAASGLQNGDDNVCVGKGAGRSLTSGGSNIMIGSGCDVSAGDRSIAIVIGKDLESAANQHARIGEGGANFVELNFSGTGNNWANTSDIRIKKNIVDGDLGLEFINKLRTIKYQDKPTSEWTDELKSTLKPQNISTECNDTVFDGFVAQEVKKVTDDLGTTFGGWQCADEKDLSQRQMLQYDKFVIPLVKAVQELSSQVTDLKKEIEELKS